MGEVTHASQRRIASPLALTRFVSTPAALRQHAGLGAANAYANRTVVKLQAPNGVAPSELQAGKVCVRVCVCGLLHLLRPSADGTPSTSCPMRVCPVAAERAHDCHARLTTATHHRVRSHQVLRTDGERGNVMSVAAAGARAAAFPRLGAAWQPASTAGAPGSKAAAGGRGVSLVWFRADLRTHDHEALAAAAAESTSLVPVFVFGTYARRCLSLPPHRKPGHVGRSSTQQA